MCSAKRLVQTAIIACVSGGSFCSPAAQSTEPNAAELVRTVRGSENWVHEVDSLYIRIEDRWTRTPEGIAARRVELEKMFPDRDLDPNRFTGLKPTSTGTLEIYFDRQRLRYLHDQHGESYMLRIWDGRQAVSHENYIRSSQEHYYLSSTPSRIFDSMLANISWLRSQPHSFWWVPMKVDERVDFFGRAEGFLISQRAQYRSTDCYVLECERKGLPGRCWRWYVGTEDQRLYGLASFCKGKIGVEHFTLDYREVAPGRWFPMTQGYELYEDTSEDQPYLRARHDLKVVDVRVNEKLPDELFKIEFKDGVQVVDERAGERRTYVYQSEPNKLIGKPLPEFDNIDIDFNRALAKDRAVLVCFWDMNQRPSRHCVSELAKRLQELEETGLVVIAVQSLRVERTVLNEWLQENNISFPIGIFGGDREEIQGNWDVRSLPWLILTDRQHIVRAEGFAVAALDEKIDAVVQK